MQNSRNAATVSAVATSVLCLTLLLGACGTASSGSTAQTELSADSAHSGQSTQSEQSDGSAQTELEDSAQSIAGSLVGAKSERNDNAETKRIGLSELGLSGFDGETMVAEVNGGIPFIDDNMLTAETYMQCGELDSLGRATGVIVCAGTETLNSGSFGQVAEEGDPTGYKKIEINGLSGELLTTTSIIDSWINQGYQSDIRNKIAETSSCLHYLGEAYDKIRDYISENDYHVIIRATPIFENDELLSRGTLAELRSVETDEINICEFVYNAEPGISIDYENLTAIRDNSYDIINEYPIKYSRSYRDSNDILHYVFKNLTETEIAEAVDDGEINLQEVYDNMYNAETDAWVLNSDSDKENAKRLIYYKLNINNEYTQDIFENASKTSEDELS